MGQRIVRDLNEGNAAKKLLTFAMPLFLSNALQAVYNIVDMVVVGQFIGKVGMSAVAIGGDILMFMTFIAMGFGNAGQVNISHSIGAENYEQVKKIIGSLFTFLFIVGVALSVVCLILRDNILRWMNTSDVAWDYAMDYMVTCCIGLVFIYGYNVVSSILRGMGDSRHPFIFISIAAVLNMVLDVLFVAVFKMEVFGAALATVIGQGVSFICSLIFLIRHKEDFHFDFKLKSFRMTKEAMEPLIKLGVPMAIQSGAVRFTKLVVNSWINSFGVDYSAVQGAASKIVTISMLVCTSFNTAGSAMVGQALGAKKFDRIKEILKAEFLYNIPIFTVFSILMLIMPKAIFSMFTHDPAVLTLCVLYVPAAILDFYGAATRAPAFALINGSGFSKLNLTIALVDGFVARIGLSYLFGFILERGARGIWIGEALAGFIPIIVAAIFYFSGVWRRVDKRTIKA